jgi:prepilin-type processing-associated H-X9-DG protein
MVDTASPGTAASRLDLDEISSEDGTTMTLLFSEKCISGTAGLNQNWWDTRPDFSFASGTSSFSFGNPLQTYPTATSNPPYPPRVVPGFGLVGTATVPKVINNAALSGQVSLPSSNHPGGAVVAFCDGRAGFLKDSLGQGVYGRLITSDGANVSGNAANAVWGAAAGPLSEGEFQ